MPFEAKYAFRCGSCDQRHPVGTYSQYIDPDHTTVSAVHCVDSGAESSGAAFDSFNRGRAPAIPVLPRGKTAKDRCDKCFLVHSTGQTECEW